MEGIMKGAGIRDTFFRDLTEDYLAKGKSSVLYADFWSENMTELLKEHFPGLLGQEPPQPDDGDALRQRMCQAMKASPERYRAELLYTDEQLRKKKGLKDNTNPRRKLWREFWLNDAGYCAGLISDSEYYLWLAEYLAAHDFFKVCIYKGTVLYKDPFYCYGWVEPLLLKGLAMNTGELKGEIKRRRSRKKGPRDEKKKAPPVKEVLSKSDVEEALKMLAEQIRLDRDAVAGRLHNLWHGSMDYRPWELPGMDWLDIDRESNSDIRDWLNESGDYLTWLTSGLEWLALHDDIREWLQNSGYPLTSNDGKEKTATARKKDRTMRLFDTFCSSEIGYDFNRKRMDGRKDGDAVFGDWYMDENGFCILDTDEEELDALVDLVVEKCGGEDFADGDYGELDQESFEKGNFPKVNFNEEAPEDFLDNVCLYIPLAMHMKSGCVFFLAGKQYYRELYESQLKTAKRRLKLAEKRGDEKLLKDARRLMKEAKAQWEKYLDKQVGHHFDYLRLDPKCDPPRFRLMPTFHENTGKTYRDTLAEFKKYCEGADSSGGVSPVYAISKVRKYNSRELDEVPEKFLWAFDI